MTIKAIETRYKGYRFRSRTEARWAVFFDALGVKWEYEPEGFELPGGGRYLPDFRLHDVAVADATIWLEIKGVAPSEAEVRSLNALYSSIPPVSCYLAVGAPGDQRRILARTWYYDEQEHPESPWEWRAWHTLALDIIRPADNLDFAPLVKAAVRAARSARFEHGECGAA